MNINRLSTLCIVLILPFFVIGQTNTKAFKKQIKNHRKHYIKEFKTGTQSPLSKKGIKKIDFFDADMTYKVEAVFTESQDETVLEIPTSAGISKQYVRYGILTFSIEGKEHTLNIYQSIQLRKMPKYRDYLFVPFKDLTNGEATYGGGRYIDIRTSEIIDNKVTLDFNKCYNPYCAYTDGYACPIPPDENHLQAKILAGEKKYKK